MSRRDKMMRIYAWINFGVNVWVSGYFVGSHRFFWFAVASAFFAGLTALYIMKRTQPKLIIVNHNHPILVPKPVYIIDAEFEEIK